MIKELKGKATLASLSKTVELLRQNQNAIIAKLRGGSLSQEQADEIEAALYTEQE